MLSSITYMAIPAKAFAQDWVYLVGSFLILGLAGVRRRRRSTGGPLL